MSTTSTEFRPAYGHDLAQLTASLVSRARETLSLWHTRATLRPRLARLDDHLLRDIGLTRAEAEHEAAKPFWQA